MQLTQYTLPATRIADFAIAPVFAQRVGIAILWSILTVTTLDLVSASTGEKFSADWQTLLRLSVCMAGGCYGVAYLSSIWHWLWCFPAAWSSLIIAWSLLTIPFSASPLYCATAIVLLVCVTLFVPALLHVIGPQRTLEHTLGALLFFVALSWLLYYFVPSLGRSDFEMPDGEVLHRFGNDAQQLGLQIAWAVGLLLIFTLSGQRRWCVTLPILLVLGITLARTQSRTGMITTAAVAAVIIWRWLAPQQKLLVGAVVVALGAIACIDLMGGQRLSLDGLAQSISRSGESEEIESLTGRTEVWETAWEKTVAAPWLGYGYGCSRFLMNEETSAQFRPNHAHNLLLNTALCIGFPGAALLLMNLFDMFWRMLRGAAR